MRVENLSKGAFRATSRKTALHFAHFLSSGILWGQVSWQYFSYTLCSLPEQSSAPRQIPRQAWPMSLSQSSSVGTVSE